MRDSLLGAAFKVVANKGFARHPEPDVVFDRLTEDGCYYLVRFYAWPGRIDDGDCRSMMLTALHDVILQNGFESPVQQLEMLPPPDLDFSFGEKETRAVLARAPLFGEVLDDEQIADLAARCKVLVFPRGATLMSQGDPPGPMYLILEGAVSITIVGADGQSHEVAVSSTGDAVGEMSLMTGAARSATATTLAALRVLEISKDGVEALFVKTPRLAERLSESLAQRQRELDAANDQSAPKDDRQTDILTRMRAFFSQALRATS